MSDGKLDPATWIDRHGDILFRYAMARVRDATVAEDLVQDTLLAAITTKDSFTHRSTVQTWLVGIMQHKILDHFRRVSRASRIVHEQPEPAGESEPFDRQGRWRTPLARWSSPEKSLEQGQFWKVFDDCLDELPESLRTPFALREIEGLDSDALAGLLNVTKNNLCVMLSRARQRLRRCLEHLWFAHDGG